MIIRDYQEFAKNGDMKKARIMLGNGGMREMKTGYTLGLLLYGLPFTGHQLQNIQDGNAMIMLLAYPLVIFGRSLFASKGISVFLFENLIKKFRFGKDIFTIAISTWSHQFDF